MVLVINCRRTATKSQYSVPESADTAAKGVAGQ